MNNIIKNVYSVSEFEKMNPNQKKDYLEYLRTQISLIETKDKIINGQKVIEKVYPLLRNYKIELYGEENLKGIDNAIFLFNHSNSHDFFTAMEFLSMLGKSGTVLAGSDCLNAFSKAVFSSADATMFDRYNKKESANVLNIFSKKIMDGKSAGLFGEATWNLHPYKTMHSVKIGGVKTAQITNVPIVPTIMEYVECDDKVNKEKDLITRCIIIIGKPIYVKYDDSLVDKVMQVQHEMESMRKNIWIQLGINRDCLDDVNKELYLNHTYVKKFKALGFIYDSAKEQLFLRPINGKQAENEFTEDEKNNFVPGITRK